MPALQCILIQTCLFLPLFNSFCNTSKDPGKYSWWHTYPRLGITDLESAFSGSQGNQDMLCIFRATTRTLNIKQLILLKLSCPDFSFSLQNRKIANNIWFYSAARLWFTFFWNCTNSFKILFFTSLHSSLSQVASTLTWQPVQQTIQVGYLVYICWILKGYGFCQMKHFWFGGWWNTVLLLICAWHSLSLCWQSVATFIQEFVKCHLDHVHKVNCAKTGIQAENLWNWTWLSYPTSYILAHPGDIC